MLYIAVPIPSTALKIKLNAINTAPLGMAVTNLQDIVCLLCTDLNHTPRCSQNLKSSAADLPQLEDFRVQCMLLSYKALISASTYSLT